jgi:hypothetical protein
MTMPDGGARSGAQNWSDGGRPSVKSWSFKAFNKERKDWGPLKPRIPLYNQGFDTDLIYFIGV